MLSRHSAKRGSERNTGCWENQTKWKVGKGERGYNEVHYSPELNWKTMTRKIREICSRASTSASLSSSRSPSLHLLIYIPHLLVLLISFPLDIDYCYNWTILITCPLEPLSSLFLASPPLSMFISSSAGLDFLPLLLWGKKIISWTIIAMRLSATRLLTPVWSLGT